MDLVEASKVRVVPGDTRVHFGVIHGIKIGSHLTLAIPPIGHIDRIVVARVDPVRGRMPG